MLTLYTAATPNGRKVPIALEELQIPYQVKIIRLAQQEQKEPWFLKLNPNGRIPVLVDHHIDDFVIFESGAILLYLAEKSQQLLPQDASGRSQVIQWLMWQMGGLGPMIGQAAAFRLHAPEKIPYAIERYSKEAQRLIEVMEIQLQQQPYLTAAYSIADIACYPWVAAAQSAAGLDLAATPQVQAWFVRIGERAAVQRGMAAVVSAA